MPFNNVKDNIYKFPLASAYTHGSSTTITLGMGLGASMPLLPYQICLVKSAGYGTDTETCRVFDVSNRSSDVLTISIAAGNIDDTDFSTSDFLELRVLAGSINDLNTAVSTNTTFWGMFLGGDGSDGDLSISSGTTTLNRDTYYNNITISGSGRLHTAGYRLYWSGVFDISAAGAGSIYAAGGSSGGAGGNTGGAGSAGISGAAGVTCWSVFNGVNGGAGGTGTGTAGQASGGNVVGGTSGAGGTGGAGGSGGGGGGGSPNVTLRQVRRITLDGTFNQGVQVFGSAGGCGGGGGGGDGSVSGGGGGGGTALGPGMFLSGNVITRGTNSTPGIFQAQGSNGGNGGSPSTGNAGGGGGGGGGGGQKFYLLVGSMTGSVIPGAIDGSGGNGGAGGNGSGTGAGGRGGNSGGGGAVFIANFGARSITYLAAGSAVAGSANSGSTGGSGGTAATTQVNL